MENVPANDEVGVDPIDLDVQYEIEVDNNPAEVNPAPGNAEANVGEARPPRPNAPPAAAAPASQATRATRRLASGNRANAYYYLPSPDCGFPAARLSRRYNHPAVRSHRARTTSAHASAHSSGARPYRSASERRAARESRRHNLPEDGMASVFPSNPRGRPSGRNRVQNLAGDRMPVYVCPSIPVAGPSSAYLPHHVPDDGIASLLYPSFPEATGSGAYWAQNWPGHSVSFFDNPSYLEGTASGGSWAQNLLGHRVSSFDNPSYLEGTASGRNRTQNWHDYGVNDIFITSYPEGANSGSYRTQNLPEHGMASFDNPSFPEGTCSGRCQTQNLSGHGMPSFHNPSFPEGTASGRCRTQNFNEEGSSSFDNPLHVLQSIPEGTAAGRYRPQNISEDGMNSRLLLSFVLQPYRQNGQSTSTSPNTASRTAPTNQPNSEMNTTQAATLNQGAEESSGTQNDNDVLDLSNPGNITEEQTSTENQFECFARSVAVQLMAMPFESAMNAQSRIQQTLSDESIQNCRRGENQIKSAD